MLQNYFNLVKTQKYWAFFTSSHFKMGLLWNLGCIHIFQDTSFRYEVFGHPDDPDNILDWAIVQRKSSLFTGQAFELLP